MIGLAVLLIVGSAAIAGLLAMRIDSRVPVLVAAHEIPVGAQITLADGHASAAIPVLQSDFGVKPYSLMLGQLKVADEVIVEIDAEIPA